MPKGSRKKKEKVADFSKAKLKLGKGKKLPSNVINTSFKARSIALPTQSIAVGKDDTQPTNKRRQSLDDILSLFKHHSAGSRKDAIFSARDLFQDHPGLLERSITSLLNACVRLIGDEDSGVRKALLSFFDWTFPRLEKKDLIPHMPLLLLFTVSAQTHIFPEIRIDAIRFLDVLLATVPESVVCGWNEPGIGHGKHILEGYLGILNAGTKFGGAEGTTQATCTTSVVLSPQSKLVVLQSLCSFLSHAIDPQSFASNGSHGDVGRATASVPTWFLRPSFANTRLFEEHENVFRPSLRGVNGKHMTWKMNPELESFDEDFVYDPRLLCVEPDTTWDLSNPPDLFLKVDDVSRLPSDISLIMRLSQTLYPTLTATFLDSAPLIFSPSMNPTETEVQMFMAAFKITWTLYSAVLQRADPGSDLLGACGELKMLLGHLTGYFPFTPAYREVKMEQAFQDLNVIYCELTSVLVLVSHQPGTKVVRRGNRFGGMSRFRSSASLKKTLPFNFQADLVQSYVIRLLQGGGTGAQLLRPISAAIYSALLPTIWAMLNQRSETVVEKDSSTVLGATVDHAMRTASGAVVKRLTIEFVGRLLLLEKEVGYTGYFHPRGGDGCKFEEWVIHLPRTLWEVGSDDLATTQTILLVLLRLLQRGSWVMQHEQISLLSSRLTPFFVMVHPVRGQVLGPFSKLPCAASHVRCLALDLCASLLTDQTRDGRMDESLHHAVSVAVKGTREELYWERVGGRHGPEFKRG